VVTLAALITYQGTAMAVGQARVQHKVMPPATTGPEPFECALRVQQNTLEQLVFFLPTFWLAALLGPESWASLLGFIWVGGRVAYWRRLSPGPRQTGPRLRDQLPLQPGSPGDGNHRRGQPELIGSGATKTANCRAVLERLSDDH